MKIGPPTPADFSSRLRGTAMTARVGLWLGLAFGVCFVTGLISHYAQNVDQPVPFPTSPVWGYRVSQGLHVVAGTAAVPLLLVKLWLVYPRLFRRPPRQVRGLVLDAVERGSIALLVASGLFLLAGGLMNAAQWYPWEFSFRRTHYAVAWVGTGALLVHVGVKLAQIREGLTARPEDHRVPEGADRGGRSREVSAEGLSRRGLLRATAAAAGIAVLATAGNTVGWLRGVSVFAVRSGEGPQGVPVNKTAAAAGVTESAMGADYRLEVVHGARRITLSREELLAMPQHSEELPIACVEGWSAVATWTGVRMRDLLALVEAPATSTVLVSSLQQHGPFGTSTLQGNFAADERTLLALALHGAPLAADHGYPARVIAPNRPGVLQTKWVSRLEVVA